MRTAVLALRRLRAIRVAADDLRPFHDLGCDDCFSSLSDPRDHTGRGRGDRARSRGVREQSLPGAPGGGDELWEKERPAQAARLWRGPAAAAPGDRPSPQGQERAAPFPVAAPLPARGEFSAFRLLLPLRGPEAGPCWSLLARRSRRGVRAAAPLLGRTRGGWHLSARPEVRVLAASRSSGYF